MTVTDLIERFRSPDSIPPTPALAGLEAIPWHTLEDAHDRATDVPPLLRALVSHDPDEREFASQLLCETVWHQGDIYSATIETVPFLYNLLEADGPQDKGAIAGVLGAIATGHVYNVEVEEGRRVEAAVRDRLRAGLDVLYPYLRHGDPRARWGAFKAVTSFPDIAARLLPDLERAAEEEQEEGLDEEMREALILIREMA